MRMLSSLKNLYCYGRTITRTTAVVESSLQFIVYTTFRTVLHSITRVHSIASLFVAGGSTSIGNVLLELPLHTHVSSISGTSINHHRNQVWRLAGITVLAFKRYFNWPTVPFHLCGPRS